jgi:hypothetical protein
MLTHHDVPWMDVYQNFKNNGIKILDAHKFLGNPIVKQNFGIEETIDIYTHDGTPICRFIINDPKKFFLKCIKYGLVSIK